MHSTGCVQKRFNFSYKLNLIYMRLHVIPVLYCPFQLAMHPLAKEIEQHTNQWILDFKLVNTLESYYKYKQSRFPTFISRTFPDGEFENLCSFSDFFTLLFLVDDKFDEEDSIKDNNSFADFENKFLEILTQNSSYSIEENNLFAALTDIWGRIRLRSTPAWQQKFVQCVRRMFEALYWQFKNILMGINPSFDEYVRIRQYLGAAHLSTDLLEFTGKIRLPEEVYQSPGVNKLTELCRNIICFSNDLFSLGKEIDESQNAGEYNLVSIIRRKYDSSMEDAIRRTADFHDHLVREFIEMSGEVYLFDNPTNEMLEKYVTALERQMSANIEWSTKETSRYPHIYESWDRKILTNQ